MVCIKVKNLRKIGYTDLQQWMSNPDNLYTGRAGRIFITDPATKEKRIFHYKGSKWKNPYTLKEYTLKESLRKYLSHLFTTGLIYEIDELRGKNLGCFCTGGTEKISCHAQLLENLLGKCYHLVKRLIDLKEKQK